jgi:hypothetical protein
LNPSTAKHEGTEGSSGALTWTGEGAEAAALRSSILPPSEVLVLVSGEGVTSTDRGDTGRTACGRWREKEIETSHVNKKQGTKYKGRKMMTSSRTHREPRDTRATAGLWAVPSSRGTQRTRGPAGREPEGSDQARGADAPGSEHLKTVTEKREGGEPPLPRARSSPHEGISVSPSCAWGGGLVPWLSFS